VPRQDPLASQSGIKTAPAGRAEAENEALEAAAQIRNLKQALNLPWQQEQDGFVLSNEELTLWMRRRQLQEEADDFHFPDRLPIL
jgi:hypothetical protein